MKAVVLHSFGPASNFRYETVPDPEPGPGQVRIVVKAIGVHLVETMMRQGMTGALPPLPELPSIFGGEVSGTVDSVGPGVDASWIGRDVVTNAGKPGGYAELAVADLAALYPVPEGLSHETAVAMIVTGTTTLQFLDVARLTPDDVVLVTSAAGGIGRLLVQYAKGLGATVIGAAGGPAKVAAVRELGADVAVDYNEPSWEKGLEPTVVLDGVGGEKARAAYSTLVDGGRYLSIGDASQEGYAPVPERGISVTNALLLLLERWEDVPRFAAASLAAAAEGRLVPAVQTFPLAEAAAAHEALAARRTTGKVVLIP
ncbi:zinc-binding dehydrogenase [Nonomuraea sp. NPDC050556]|uniref:zinc-binding dehydrogenase n=1 Tax=Nonomuraea sp. NPDC050556 TaxID=3364369 RepID=UPI00378D9BF5